MGLSYQGREILPREETNPMVEPRNTHRARSPKRRGVGNTQVYIIFIMRTCKALGDKGLWYFNSAFLTIEKYENDRHQSP